MIRKIMRNFYIGRYGEDLSFSLEKKNKKDYILCSFVIKRFNPITITKKDRMSIIEYYCNLGASLDSIHYDDLHEMKVRAQNLTTMLLKTIDQYHKTNNKSDYEDLLSIFRDIECLKLSDEQYNEWIINYSKNDDVARYKAEYELERCNH